MTFITMYKVRLSSWTSLLRRLNEEGRLHTDNHLRKGGYEDRSFSVLGAACEAYRQVTGRAEWTYDSSNPSDSVLSVPGDATLSKYLLPRDVVEWYGLEDGKGSCGRVEFPSAEVEGYSIPFTNLLDLPKHLAQDRDLSSVFDMIADALDSPVNRGQFFGWGESDAVDTAEKGPQVSVPEKRFQITESDLQQLEAMIPDLVSRAQLSTDDPLVASIIATKARVLQRILTSVRWEYGPWSNIDRVEA